MTSNLGEIDLELLGLPAKSRAVLAHKLIESLEEEESPDAAKQWIEVAKQPGLAMFSAFTINSLFNSGKP